MSNSSSSNLLSSSASDDSLLLSADADVINSGESNLGKRVECQNFDTSMEKRRAALTAGRTKYFPQRHNSVELELEGAWIFAYTKQQVGKIFNFIAVVVHALLLNLGGGTTAPKISLLLSAEIESASVHLL